MHVTRHSSSALGRTFHVLEYTVQLLLDENDKARINNRLVLLQLQNLLLQLLALTTLVIRPSSTLNSFIHS